MPTRRPLRTSAAVLFAGAALGLAGCGGDWGISTLAGLGNHRSAGRASLDDALPTREDLAPVRADLDVLGTYHGERGEDRTDLFACQGGPIGSLGSRDFAIRRFAPSPNDDLYDWTVASVVVRFSDAAAARSAVPQVERWLTSCKERLFPDDESARDEKGTSVSAAGGRGVLWTHVHDVRDPSGHGGAGHHDFLGVGTNGRALVITVCGYTSQAVETDTTDPGGVMLRAALKRARRAGLSGSGSADRAGGASGPARLSQPHE